MIRAIAILRVQGVDQRGPPKADESILKHLPYQCAPMLRVIVISVIQNLLSENSKFDLVPRRYGG
jgi:hypothetical protein